LFSLVDFLLHLFFNALDLDVLVLDIQPQAAEESATTLTLLHAVLPRLAKDLFVRHGPGNACHWNGENKCNPKLYCVICRKMAYEKEAFLMSSVAWPESEIGLA